jgi:hypothetical protein
LKDYHINIFYSEEDKVYIADIPDLSYCSSFVDTQEAALKDSSAGQNRMDGCCQGEGQTDSPTALPSCHMSYVLNK